MKTLPRLVVLSLVCFPILTPARALETEANNTGCAVLSATAVEDLPLGNRSAVDFWSIAPNPANPNQLLVGETDYSTNSNGQAQGFYFDGLGWISLTIPSFDDRGHTFTNNGDIQFSWSPSGPNYSEILFGPSQGYEVAVGAINTGGSVPTLQTPTPVISSTIPIKSQKFFVFKYDPGFYDIYLTGDTVAEQFSTDGGKTWSTPRTIVSNPNIIQFDLVGPSSSNLDFFATVKGPTANSVITAKSTNAGLSFSATKSLYGYMPPSNLGPFLDKGAVAVSDNSGLVYFLDDGLGQINSRVYNPETGVLSSPIKINTTTSTEDVAMVSSAAINPSTGQFFSSWYEANKTDAAYQLVGTQTLKFSYWSKPRYFNLTPISPGSAYRPYFSSYSYPGSSAYFPVDGATGTPFIQRLFETDLTFNPAFSFTTPVLPNGTVTLNVGETSTATVPTVFTLTFLTNKLAYKGVQLPSNMSIVSAPKVGNFGTLTLKSTMAVKTVTWKAMGTPKTAAGSTIPVTLTIIDPTGCGGTTGTRVLTIPVS